VHRSDGCRVPAHELRRRLVAVGLALGSLLIGTAAACSDDRGSSEAAPSASSRTSDDAVAEDALRILPLGDSITDGLDIPGSYRTTLAADAAAAGMAYDFVGSLRNGRPGLTDEEHEGHTGWRIDQITTIARDVVSTYRPDVVLVMIGTNDIGQRYQLDSVTERLRALIDTLAEAAPELSIFVSTLPPLVNSAGNVDAFNAALPAVVATANAAGHQVELVDAGGRLTLDDMPDGVHPSAAGHAEIGHAWARAILRARPG
jgi:lysophospholipase L1-like esterase